MDRGQSKGPYLPELGVQLGQLGRLLPLPRLATQLELGQEGLARPAASLGCHTPGTGHIRPEAGEHIARHLDLWLPLLHQFLASLPIVIQSTLEETRFQSVHDREEVASIDVGTVDILLFWEVLLHLFMFKGEPEHLLHRKRL